jgi:hypothetical protein
MKSKLLTFLVLFFLIARSSFSQQPNTLTALEKQEGWRLLFDGKSVKNWHVYGQKGVGPAWKIQDQSLVLDASNRTGNKTNGGGDLVTDEVFKGDYEFKIEWKVSPLANSGIFLFVTESPSYKEIYHTGLELQVLDNAIYKDAKDDNKKRAGDLYGVVSTAIMEVRPVGEWNQIHVINKKGVVKIYMNGFEIHDVKFNSNEWKESIGKSLLKNAPVGKGKFEGRIGLQDWGSTVYFRNIKIKSL